MSRTNPSKWIKLLTIPWVLLCGFLGAVKWVENGLLNKWPEDTDDDEAQKNFGGWLGPEMKYHWVRWWKTPWSKHDTKNLGTEWVKLSGERAYKYGSFALVVTFAWAVSATLVAIFT